MLERLLEYHQNLISDEFIQALLTRIQKRYQTRVLVLGIFSLLGLAAALIAVNGLLELNWYRSFEQYLTDMNLTMVASIVAAIGFIGFVVWIFNEEIQAF